MLNLTLSNELNRASKLKIFLLAKVSIFLGFLPFNKAYTSFLANLATFEAEANKKESKSKGVTLTKAQLKKRIATKLGLILSKTQEYANDIGDINLSEKVNYTVSNIARLKDADVLPFVTSISTNVYTAALFANATFITYNITAAQVAAVLADATTFNNKIGEVNVVDSSASTANKNINLAIDAIHKNIDSMNNLIDEFAITNPDFVDGYHQNAALDNLGIRHQGVEGIIHFENQLKEGVIVKLIGTDKSARTDREGHYSIIQVKIGDYTVQANLNEDNTQSKPITVQRKQIQTVDFDF